MFTKPIKCCGLCKNFQPFSENFHKGMCLLEKNLKILDEEHEKCFEHRGKISVDMFSYFADRVSADIDLETFCKILGLSYSEAKK